MTKDDLIASLSEARLLLSQPASRHSSKLFKERKRKCLGDLSSKVSALNHCDVEISKRNIEPFKAPECHWD